MTLVMDGVRGASMATRRPLVQPMRRLATPVLPVAPVVGASYRVGMDGIRRAVPTPREVLAGLQSAEIAPEASVFESAAILTPAIIDWQRIRQAAAFSILATTLTAAGTVTAVSAAHITAKATSPVLSRAASIISSTVPSAAAASSAVPSAGSAAAAVAPVDTGLQQLLNNFVAGQSNMYRIYVKNLSTGEVASINPDVVTESASLYKLYVANTVYHQIDTGVLSLGQSVDDADNTVEGCLSLMITISDNTCGRALRTMTGLSDGSTYNQTDGFTNTVLTGDYPQTTATDVARLFERIYDNDLNSPVSNDSFLSLLKGQLVNNRLPLGLPAGTTIAHKTGDLDGYVHDAGIVYGAKANYIVVVMSGDWDSPGNAPAQFVNLSQQLWSHIEQ